MSNAPVYYKDTRVSPNSALYVALVESKNPNTTSQDRAKATARAEAIYQECEREYRKWMPR